MDRPIRKPRKQRPWVVAEFTYQMNFHGRLWTVGCKTEEAALASFHRRVAKNLAETSSPGAVIAFDRESRQPVAWTDEVDGPNGVLTYFVR